MTDTTTEDLARRAVLKVALVYASDAERTDALVWLAVSPDRAHQEALVAALDAARSSLFYADLADLLGVDEAVIEEEQDRAGPFTTGALETLRRIVAESR
jgi:hypothetical protein